MSDADPVFADWSIHLIPFLIISGIVVAGFVILVTWLSSAAYAVPEGVEEKLITDQILACFMVEDYFTSQKIDAVDKTKFTQGQLDGCIHNLKNAYRLTLGEKTIATERFDQMSAVDKHTPLHVRVIEHNIITDAQLIIEVQHG